MKMMLSIRRLRAILNEAIDTHDMKELRRARLQDLINDEVRFGHVSDQAGIDSLFLDMDMALKALKMVPYGVWAKLSKPDKQGG